MPAAPITGHSVYMTRSTVLNQILKFHCRSGSLVLDPTYGIGDLWKDVEGLWDIVESDKYGHGPCLDVRTLLEDRPGWVGVFDVIVYDPPMPFHNRPISDKADLRVLNQGQYTQTSEDISSLQRAIIPLAQLLKLSGKFIVRSMDFYSFDTRDLFLTHIETIHWLLRAGLRVIDLHILIHPTVPLVSWLRPRRSSVINHSYFIVGEKHE